MPLITKRSDIDDLPEGPTPAEEQLLAACMAGEICKIGDGRLPPEDAGKDRQIRAEVLRYLILGGCEDCRVQGHGVRLYGARITGTLDLSYQTARGTTDLMHCRFENRVEAMQTHFTALYLNNSHLPALNAERTQVTGNVFLCGANTTGEVRLSAATIGGQLACDGATLSNENGHALNAHTAEVNGGVFLRHVTTAGEVNFSGATIRMLLTCNGATLFKRNGHAFNAQGMQLTGGLFWTLVNVKAGYVDLNTARITTINDTLESWPGGGQLRLTGLTYDNVFSSLDLFSRLAWLAKNTPEHDGFAPQPYTHLAKVYRAMGRDRDARDVLFERERLELKDQRRRARKASFGRLRASGIWAKDQFLRWTIGYGYRPFNPLIGLIGLWALATILAHMAWTTGTFAPNSGPVQVSAAWQDFISCQDKCPENPALAWSTQTQPGQDWETFNSFAYGADLVVPIIDFGQTDAWVPSTARGRWGTVLWGAGFVLNLFGWIITALGAAALTGIIQKERE